MKTCDNCGSTYLIGKNNLCGYCADYERRFSRPRPISEKRMEQLGRKPTRHGFTMPPGKTLVEPRRIGLTGGWPVLIDPETGAAVGSRVRCKPGEVGVVLR